MLQMCLFGPMVSSGTKQRHADDTLKLNDRPRRALSIKSVNILRMT